MLRSVFIATTALAAPALLAAPAAAEIYGTVRYGVAEGAVDLSGASLDSQQGTALGAALGVDLGGPLRVEASVDNATVEFLGGAVEGSLVTYSASIMLDLPVGGAIRPFVGVGADYSEGEANIGFNSLDAEGTGWHWDVGARTNLNDRWSLEVMRREHSGDLDVGGGDINVETVAWTLGLSRAL